ncbi:MAG: amidase [Melioribacteraceae bacterium]|nr:amidase [Melioribacteraceae bacterium]MCF8263986.1 amidase [Melioribacteraceae bacterium]MCF8430743.1 amidase [Melioribacteraceae bacterium]
MKRIYSCFAIILLALQTSVSSAQEKDSVSIENIKSSEILINLNFTDSERDSMLADLYDQLANYKDLHKYEIKNSIPPAVQFNPIPVGFDFPDEQKPLKFDDYSNTKMPEDRNALAFYSIGELAHLIKSQKISSLELTKFFIERLKKFDPVLHCVITLTEERAIKFAKKADEEIASGNYKGKLHGIPFGVKDLLTVEGYKTTWGATPFKDQVINETATVVKKLEESGGVLVAKLTMGALAWGDVWFGGKTRNPWNTEQGSSGSSAGSASAVSAGLVPFAIGTETWGSIVSPSTVCGTSGLRPTYGRVSRTGAMALSWTMDKIGTIARTTEDLAIVFDAIQGEDQIDQTLYNVPFNYDNEIDLSKLKIGYLKNDFDGDYPFHKNDSLALVKMKELGAELIPIELPKFDQESLSVYDISFILSAEAAAAFDLLTRSNKDDLLVRQGRNAWPNVFRSARFIPAVEYINANRLRYILIQQMEKIMSDIDLYIAPSWVGENLLLTNLTGHPCVVVPNGFSEEGTPTTFTFIGKLFDEGTILAIAKKYQDATGFQLKHPEQFK